MKNFKELKIWQKGIEITVSCYQLTAAFPNTEKFGLSNQINRAAVSIPSNIAEGSSRSSEKDYRRFLEIALGSIFELETQFIITQKLNLLPTNAFEECNELIQKIQMMLYGLMRKLNS